jgi:hypothetical protein
MHFTKMKIAITFLFSAFTLFSYAQKEPMLFLDSVRITKDQMYFDPNKIETINVVKTHDTTSKTNGKIFITSKKPHDFNFLTLAQVKNTFAKNISSPTIFMLDNEFIKDTTTFKIDFSYILKVEITKAADIAYLKNALPDFAILKIITRTKENLEKQNQIHIREEQTTKVYNPSK